MFEDAKRCFNRRTWGGIGFRYIVIYISPFLEGICYRISRSRKSCKKSKKFLPAKNHFQRFANMTKKKVKEERRNLLDKYSIPMSEIPDKDLKDNKGWVWLKDLIDY